jgi:glycosyltransferase involved in cell wall biosynthesis
MVAGKPIVAARAAAVPEVVRSGILVEPQNAEALADGILRLYRSPDLCKRLASAGRKDVEDFDVLRVARVFSLEVAKVLPGMAIGLSDWTDDRNGGIASIQQPREVLK